jgi:hypothetical protein
VAKFFKSLLRGGVFLGVIRPWLQPRQSHPPQQLAYRPLMHHDLIALRYHHAQVDAAPAGYPVECQVGASKHQVLQVLHLLG